MSGWSLYELATQEYELLTEAINHFVEAGDTQEDAVQKSVAAIDLLTEKKVISYACIIKQLEAEAEAIEKQEKMFQTRRKSAENKATLLRARMIELLPHEQKWKAAEAEVSFRKSKACEITELDAIPTAFRRNIPATWAPEKNEIMEELKAGKEVPGARIKENWSVTIK